MAARMHNVNCSSARHFEAFADIPQELACKIVAYRKIRKRIFHIDELYRIGGISRKYFRRLASVFYVPNQVVPRIGAQLPYSNALSTVTVEQKHQNRNANLKKRKMKIKKSENQRKIESRDRKRELKREGISQYKPLALGTKCNLSSTNLKRLNTHIKLAENLGKKVQKKEGKIVKYRIAKRRKTTEIEQNSVQSSESTPSTQRANINEASERAAIPKLEGGNKDMEEDNIHVDMEEVLTYRKRPYRCVKRPKTTDTENSCDSSESITSLASAIVQRANTNERVARLSATIPKLEGDNRDMEEDNIHVDMEEDNIDMEGVLAYRKRPETTDTENRSYSLESIPSLASAIVQRANINEGVDRLLANIPKLEGDNKDMEENNVEMEEDNIHTYRKRQFLCVNRPETTDTKKRSESSESAPSTRLLNINERVARLLAAVPKLEDNIDMEEDNIPTCSKRAKYSSDSSEYSIDSSQHSSDSSQHSSDSSQHSSDSSEYRNNSSKYSSNSSEYSSNSSEYSSDSLVYNSNSSEYSSDSSESIPSVVVQRGNINERVARLLAAIPKLEGDNKDMEEDNIHVDIEEDNIDMEGVLAYRKRPYRVKRPKTTDTENSCDSSESITSLASAIIQPAKTNERVARLSADIPKLEGGNKDMEEDNIHVDMEEDNIDMEEVLTYRKRPYRCVKRPETTDTENSSESSESIPSLASAIVQPANINEGVDRLLANIPKLEGDNIDLEENNVEMEEDNIDMEEDNIPTCSKRPKYSIDSSEYSIDSSQHSSDSSQHSSDSSEYSNNSSKYSSNSLVYSSNSSEYSSDSLVYSSNSSEYSSNSLVYSSNSSEYSSDSSESIPSVVVQRGNINERVARLLATVHTLEGDNMEMEEDNSLTNRKRKYQSDSVKRQETTGTDQRSKHSVSIPASVIEQEYNDAMKRVARWILTIPNFESDTYMEMEEDTIEMEKENIRPGHVYI
jgi:DNA uptake protein ComE-like DNA-binding protein